MKWFKAILTSSIVCLALSTQAQAEVKAGDAAPQFEAKDANGKAVKLSDYKGKWVVLEWFNKGCPYVRKHYSGQNMQNLQKTYTEKGVVWLTINSTNPKNKDYVTDKVALEDAANFKASPTAIIPDGEGKIGKSYGAKTTPHMYVINPEQKIVYAGAIDDKPTFDAADIKGSKNYVDEALKQGMAGKAITDANVKPYGCSVKYL